MVTLEILRFRAPEQCEIGRGGSPILKASEVRGSRQGGDVTESVSFVVVGGRDGSRGRHVAAGGW